VLPEAWKHGFQSPQTDTLTTDDRPELLHAALLPWLDALPAGGPACGAAAAAAAGGGATDR
jgi:hypothetical protein